MPKIRIKVEQFDDEPAWSVLHRLARLAGTASARDFCLDFGLDRHAIEAATELSVFARRGGYDLEMLERNSILTDGQSYAFGDETILFGGLASGVNRVCVCCLRHDLEHGTGRPTFRPHWREWWFVKGIGACPFHGVELTTVPLKSSNDRIPGDLLDPLQGIDRQPVPKPAQDVACERYVLGRLGYMPRIDHWLLDRLPLGNGLTAIRNFGLAVRFDVVSDGDDLRADVGTNELMAAGFGVLTDRPRLDAFLDDLFARAEPPMGNWGPRVVYGRLYDWLREERKPVNTGMAFDVLRTIVLEHALRTFPVNPGEEFFGKRIPSRNIYTLKHLWDRTGIHTTRLRTVLLEVGIIDEAVAARDDWHIFVSAADVDALVERLAGRMTRLEMTVRYGIPRGTFPVLQKAGMLKAWTQTGKAGEGQQIWLRSDMDEWFARLKGVAPVVASVPAGASSLVVASRMAQTSVDNIVGALLDGRLRACGVLEGETPWASVVVMIGEIRALFDDDASSGMLGWDETIAFLRTTHAVLKALVVVEKLSPVVLSGTTGKPKQCFDRTALEAFDREFISMKEAAKYLGTHSRVLRGRLAEQETHPAFDLGISPASAYYRRDRIEPLGTYCCM